MASAFAGSALPWPRDDLTDGPLANSGEEGDAVDEDEDEDTAETADTGTPAGSSEARPRKRHRGSRGSGRNKLALEAEAPSGLASADATPASPLEEDAGTGTAPEAPTSATLAGGVENGKAEKGDANG
jgi:hypothetical protein